MNMKKILLTSIILLTALFSLAQYPAGIQTIGADSNVIVAKGGLRANGGYINTPYTDTTAANLKRIRQYQGAQIVIGNDIWVRDATGTKWNKIFTGAEADPIFSASPAFGITNGNITNWNTAFSWGNHAGLYSLITHNHTLDGLSNVGIVSKATGDLLKWNGSAWVNFAPTYISSYTETDPITKAINGLVKSNGTTISAAVAGTDYDNLFDVSGGTITLKPANIGLNMQGNILYGNDYQFNTGSYGFGGQITLPSALVAMSSTTKGFRPPSMTTTEVNAISSPADGLQAYDNVLKVPKFFNGTSWLSFLSSANSYENPLTFSIGLTRATNTITNNLSTGLSGGQTVTGGTGSGENLTLSSTSNATKGKILIGTSAYDEVNDRFGFGVTTPLATLHLKAGTTAAGTAPIKKTSGTLMTTAEAGAEEYNNNFYQTKAGPLRYALGGTIATFMADVLNSSTTETDLFTYTTPASTLSNSGQFLIAKFSGEHKDATATIQLKVYFAGSVIADVGALTVSAIGQWDCDVMIIRSGTNARCATTFKIDGASIVTSVHRINLSGITYTNTNILKITGTAGGAGGGSGDIEAQMGHISFYGAANN